MAIYEAIQEAVTAIRRLTEARPRSGIVLGTGLSGLVHRVQVEARIPYGRLPHFVPSTAPSHRGELVFGHIQGHAVVVMAGRLHYYEGWTMQQITFPVRVLGALGIERLILTNASGGVNPHLRSGDIVIVRDHINLLPENPLRGPNDERIGPRFPDMSQPYDPDLRRLALEVAREQGIRAVEGVYSALQGPNLETPAEYAMLRLLGSDCTGMSSVPEVLVARHQGIPVLLLSLVTNTAYPPSVIRETTVDDVVAIAKTAEPRLTQLLGEILRRLT